MRAEYIAALPLDVALLYQAVVVAGLEGDKERADGRSIVVVGVGRVDGGGRREIDKGLGRIENKKFEIFALLNNFSVVDRCFAVSLFFGGGRAGGRAFRRFEN